VEATLDTGDYPIGVSISKERFAALPLERHATHGAWNYTLLPEPATTTEAVAVGESSGPAQRRHAMLARLADPRLTGMTNTEFARLATQLARPKPPAPTSATPNSVVAELGVPQETCALSHCSTTPPAFCSP